jgi:uncharacterized protein
MSSEAPYGRTEDGHRFWESAKTGSLVFQRCDDCDFIRWPSAGVCPECLSRKSTWVGVEGTGWIWSFVVYRRAYAPSLKESIPYNVALVELSCGVRLVTKLVDFEPGEAVVGAPVSVRYAEIGEQGPVPVFGPAR